MLITCNYLIFSMCIIISVTVEIIFAKIDFFLYLLNF